MFLIIKYLVFFVNIWNIKENTKDFGKVMHIIFYLVISVKKKLYKSLTFILSIYYLFPRYLQEMSIRFRKVFVAQTTFTLFFHDQYKNLIVLKNVDMTIIN